MLRKELHALLFDEQGNLLPYKECFQSFYDKLRTTKSLIFIVNSTGLGASQRDTVKRLLPALADKRLDYLVYEMAEFLEGAPESIPISYVEMMTIISVLAVLGFDMSSIKFRVSKSSRILK